MTVNYDGRIFRGASNTDNGEVGTDTVFFYHQRGTLLFGEYHGGDVVAGQLLGAVAEDGVLDFCYHHVNTEGTLMAGRCRSSPRQNGDGLLELDESWQWLTGDRSAGTSVVTEISDQQVPIQPRGFFR